MVKFNNVLYRVTARWAAHPAKHLVVFCSFLGTLHCTLLALSVPRPFEVPLPDPAHTQTTRDWGKCWLG